MGVSGSRPSPAEQRGPCLLEGESQPQPTRKPYEGLLPSCRGISSEGARVLASKRAMHV